MIKHIMIALILIIGLSGLGNASGSNLSCVWNTLYDFSGTNVNYNYRMIYYADIDNCTIVVHSNVKECIKKLNASPNQWMSLDILNQYYTDYDDPVNGNIDTMSFSTGAPKNSITCGGKRTDKVFDIRPRTGTFFWVNIYKVNQNYQGDSSYTWTSSRQSGTVFFTTDVVYNVTGQTDCLEEDVVNLYWYVNGNWVFAGNNSLEDDYYNFTTINGTYKLNFSDGHEYEFIVEGNDIIYNRDLCASITLNFKDNCNNLIRKTAGTYYNSGDPFALFFYAINGTYDILFEDQEYLELWVDSAAGTLYYNISNPQNNSIIIYTISNPTISWNNNIYVIDGNTSLLIENALVMFSQDCIIMPTLYPSRNKFTNTFGLANFEQCELDSFSLGISATNYKSFFDNNISSDNLSAFLLEQTIVVKLYPSTDENESEYNYTDYSTWINFKDINGNYTTSILDTDNYVDLYYYNNNTEDVSMTLKFQKYNISTGLTDLLSWNIPKETNGYKRILKSNYTDTLSSYRGYLYNYTINGWDRIEYLAVRNETSEIDLDYQNLSAFTWFKNKNIEGSIDYREDIEIIAYANSTYVGLLVISLELYNNNSFVTHTNLTWADFTTADLKYFYEWSPAHSYENGHNYTIRMHGYDYYLLNMDYINATNYRKNKLTILVKNQDGIPLDNAFIYLEDYGSLSTNTNNYNSYENLDNGYYRYKATKPDYAGAGWSDITLSDSDEIVTYTLTATDSDAANATQPQKIDESELQNIYLIIMAFLLIFIIIGGLKYAL